MKGIYLGRQDYRSVLALQKKIFDAKVLQAKARRGVPVAGNINPPGSIPNIVLAVEHSPSVITMGKRDTSGGLRLKDGGNTNTENGEGGEASSSLSPTPTNTNNTSPSPVEVVKTSRGGGLTWHGHGQVTVYPVLDVQSLWKASTDPAKGKSPLMWYSTVLEECMIRTAADYDVVGERGAVGVWVRQTESTPTGPAPKCIESSSTSDRVAPGETSRYADTTTDAENTMKLGAVGLAVSNWVSMHGIGFNVSNDLKQFDSLVMCELPGKKATNLHREMSLREKKTTQDTAGNPAIGKEQRRPGLPEVAGRLIYHLGQALQQPKSSQAAELNWCSAQQFESTVLQHIK